MIPYHWLSWTILDTSYVVLYVISVLVGSVIVFLVHRYLVRTNYKEQEVQPFYIRSVIYIVLFNIWNLITVLYQMPFYTVLFVGWSIHVFGYILYRLEQANHSKPIKPHDLRNAFFISAIVFSIIAMMFVTIRVIG